MVTRSLVAISSQRTVLGSRLAATTRATRSRSVTIATTRPPSTTGRGPFSLAIISLATSTTLIDGDTVTTSAVMTCLTWGRPPAGWRRRQRRRASRSAAEVSVGRSPAVGGGVTSAGAPSPARCLPVLRRRASTAARRPGPGPPPRAAGAGRLQQPGGHVGGALLLAHLGVEHQRGPGQSGDHPLQYAAEVAAPDGHGRVVGASRPTR